MAIIEKDEINLIKKIDLNKIIANLYFDFNNGINLIYKIIKFKIYFSNESLIQLSNYLYNNHNEDEQNNSYNKIKKLLLEISYNQTLSKVMKDKLELEDFSFKGKTNKINYIYYGIYYQKIKFLKDIMKQLKI